MVLSHSELISSTIKKIGILISTSQGYCEDQKKYDSNPDSNLAGTQQMSDSLTFYLYENIMQNNLTMMVTIITVIVNFYSVTSTMLETLVFCEVCSFEYKILIKYFFFSSLLFYLSLHFLWKLEIFCSSESSRCWWKPLYPLRIL